MPSSFASVRMLQCVAFAGLSCVVLWTMRGSSLFALRARRPPRGASFSMPAHPRAAKRPRHSPTVWRLVFKRRAISWLCTPSAASRTAFARSTNRAGVLRPRDHLLKIVFSSGDNSIFGATRDGFVLRGSEDTLRLHISQVNYKTLH